ncbi:MAG: nlpE1 [Parcubacteria group bacterium]|nr:nlpE1 [Parcubacteria group bacterium]
MHALRLRIYRLLNRSWPIALTFGGRKLWGWKPLSLIKPHEPETALFFEQYIKPGMRVADVGANVGWYTLMFSDLVGEQGHVYAYEPDPKSFSRLEKGVLFHQKKNKIHNIELFNAAVAESEGEIDLYGKLGSGRNSTSHQGEGELVTRSKAVLLPNDIDIAKIDVEGGEISVLRGSMPKAATVEYSFSILDREGESGSNYLDTIRALGYEIYTINSYGEPQLLSGLPSGQGHVNLFIKLRN